MTNSRHMAMVCMTIPHYLPSVGYGGPVYSLKEIAGLADVCQATVEIACLDHFYDTKKLIPNVSRLDNVRYLEKTPLTWLAYGYKSFERFSTIYVNSFFHPYASFWIFIGIMLASLRRHDHFKNKKLVISPRGELLAARIFSRKSHFKLLYVRVVKLIILFLKCDVSFVASSEEERESICKYFPGWKIHVLPNLVSRLLPSPGRASQCLANNYKNKPLSLIYFSRISPEKGLYEILIQLSSLEINFVLNVYGGSVAKKYLLRCKSAASMGALNEKVVFHGPYDRSNIPEMCATSDIFLYRPIAENFSHAFFEALMCEIIPVVPNTIPWRFNSKRVDEFIFYDMAKSGSLASRLLNYSGMSISEREDLRRSVFQIDLPGQVIAGAASDWKKVLF